MAWDKADITTDITSQLHATGGAKANEIQSSAKLTKAGDLQAQITDPKARHTTSQVLKQNEIDAQHPATAPAQNQNGPGPSSGARKSTEEDRVELSADVRDLTYVSRQAESPINKGPNGMVLEKKIEEKPGPMRQVHDDREKPSEKAEQLHMILSGETPAKMSLAEEAKSGMFAGYSQEVENLAEVDQDHPENAASMTARIDAAEKEQAESKPGAVESEVGQTLDKLI